MVPRFFMLHPLDANEAEEEAVLMSLSFGGGVRDFFPRVHSYIEWAKTQKQTGTYELLRRMMLIIQWEFIQRQARLGAPVHPESLPRFLLKAPLHSEFLPELVQVFPGVQVVQLHRDPAKSVGSLASMLAQLANLYCDDITLADAHGFGALALEKSKRMLFGAMNYRESETAKELPAGTFVDVQYSELVRDAVSEVRRVYGLLGMELPAKLADEMAAHHAARVQHQHGRHTYDIADFGLRREGVAAEFARYTACYGIRPERDGR
eukprot:TRINITY_DN2909_c0_g1_i2.p1 TRINITY_DN2909_c0_g1~~TRINITY_DN2909_c0_g1_i2.p1  ORF type:complete len:264 (+),score=50.47 TRINITY_DN2909_c0_g1_i2:190-981(+)